MVNKMGCSYGIVTREKILNLERAVLSIENSLLNVSNHYSQRLPTWASVVMTILGIMVGALIGSVL